MKLTLSALVASTGSIETPQGTLEVRGLTIRDIGHFAKKYANTLALLVDKGAENIDWRNVLLDSPEFCHEVIARVVPLGVHSIKATEVAAQLPAGLQIQILIEAWNQTAIDPEMVSTAVKKILDLLTSVSTKIGSNP